MYCFLKRHTAPSPAPEKDQLISTEISQLETSLLKPACYHTFNSLRTAVRRYLLCCFLFSVVKEPVRCEAVLCWMCFWVVVFFLNLKDSWKSSTHSPVSETQIRLETWWGLLRFWIIENVSKLCTVLMLIYDTFVLQYEVSCCVKREVSLWFLFLSQMSRNNWRMYKRKHITRRIQRYTEGSMCISV